MELLSLNPLSKSNFLEGEQEGAMLESCLTFLASLMSIRTNIGIIVFQSSIIIDEISYSSIIDPQAQMSLI